MRDRDLPRIDRWRDHSWKLIMDGEYAANMLTAVYHNTKSQHGREALVKWRLPVHMVRTLVNTIPAWDKDKEVQVGDQGLQLYGLEVEVVASGTSPALVVAILV